MAPDTLKNSEDFAAEDGQLDPATAASLAGSESNVESSSKDGGIAGADTASLSD